MTTSLRDEIDNYIKYIHEPYEPDICNVDEIIKLIKKRIDSDIGQQSTIVPYLWAIGYNDAVKKMKEMLK